MRQINFLIIFALCLTLVLFGMENTELEKIQIIPNLQVEAPISIELILAMGMGAVIAWIFSLWTRLQRWLVSRQAVRQRDVRIQELEHNFEQYKAEAQDRQLTLPPASSPSVQEATEAFAK